MKNPIFVIFFGLLILLFGYPLACLIEHGFDVQLWPSVAEHPGTFVKNSLTSGGVHLVEIYRTMFAGQDPVFAAGGFMQALTLLGTLGGLSIWMSMPTVARSRRDPSETYGGARWASAAERRRLSAGLEVGTDPVTGRTIRVAVRSNLVTIAPPRTGKTSGLLIPNLLVPEANAWSGPAVVIDPKGEVYTATARRRRELGRRVMCLDPIGTVNGRDTWNPLQDLDPNNILSLQRVARALLPDTGSSDGQYFRDRAVDVIVAGFQAAHQERRMTARRVSQYLSDTTLFARVLQGIEAGPARNVVALLDADAKTRDPILSTAAQAFQWCDDPRLQTLTNSSNVDLADVCRGEADLFITLPTEDLRGLAPLIRWLLAELFSCIRRHTPTERLVIFVDEAKVLGKFDEIIIGSGELPGYNCSLWTFWQDKSQIRSTYGQDNEETILATAEIVTISDLALIDQKGREHVSQSIGEYTQVEEAQTVELAQNGQPGRKTASHTPKAVRLVTPDALASMPSTDLIVLPNSPLYGKRPMQIRKTRYNDPRFTRFSDATSHTVSAARDKK